LPRLQEEVEDEEQTKQDNGGRNGTQMATVAVPKGGLVGSYAQREAWLRQQEEEGELRFVVIQNDKTMQNMKWCVEWLCKNCRGDQPIERTMC